MRSLERIVSAYLDLARGPWQKRHIPMTMERLVRSDLDLFLDGR